MNCQLYSGWRLGKHKPGTVSDWEGLVDAAGESIEVRGVGFSYRVWVSTHERDGASFVDLCNEIFWWRQLDAVGVVAAVSGKEAGMRCARGWGAG